MEGDLLKLSFKNNLIGVHLNINEILDKHLCEGVVVEVELLTYSDTIRILVYGDEKEIVTIYRRTVNNPKEKFDIKEDVETIRILPILQSYISKYTRNYKINKLLI